MFQLYNDTQFMSISYVVAKLQSVYYDTIPKMQRLHLFYGASSGRRTSSRMFCHILLINFFFFFFCYSNKKDSNTFYVKYNGVDALQTNIHDMK